MQLPRGTFREIRKGETIENLIGELERLKFSGICSISSSAGTGTLVYKSGKCILVKFLGKSGDSGCAELQKNRTCEVDAALSTLDDAQIQLSLEFNKACRLVKAVKPLDSAPAAPAPEPVRKVPPPPAAPAAPPAPSAPLKAPPKPAAASSLFHRPAAPQPSAQPEQRPEKPVTAPQRPAMPAPPAAPQPRAAQPPADTESDAGSQHGSSFDKDIDTFDTMDLDNVTDKIRNDCKTMIKQLHLEHLMER
ncbi:MAG: hypothetical protein GYA23_02480 [Methanomicrobiales archaeon]|nr:hypothetical protein [Methanomicrobiales archaeon]